MTFNKELYRVDFRSALGGGMGDWVAGTGQYGVSLDIGNGTNGRFPLSFQDGGLIISSLTALGETLYGIGYKSGSYVLFTLGSALTSHTVIYTFTTPPYPYDITTDGADLFVAANGTTILCFDTSGARKPFRDITAAGNVRWIDSDGTYLLAAEVTQTELLQVSDGSQVWLSTSGGYGAAVVGGKLFSTDSYDWLYRWSDTVSTPESSLSLGHPPTMFRRAMTGMSALGSDRLLIGRYINEGYRQAPFLLVDALTSPMRALANVCEDSFTSTGPVSDAGGNMFTPQAEIALPAEKRLFLSQDGYLYVTGNDTAQYDGKRTHRFNFKQGSEQYLETVVQFGSPVTPVRLLTDMVNAYAAPARYLWLEYFNGSSWVEPGDAGELSGLADVSSIQLRLRGTCVGEVVTGSPFGKMYLPRPPEWRDGFVVAQAASSVITQFRDAPSVKVDIRESEKLEVAL